MLGVSGIGERNWVLVPRGDFEILDNWYVSRAAWQRKQGYRR